MARSRDKKQCEIFLDAYNAGKTKSEASKEAGWHPSTGGRYLEHVKENEPWLLNRGASDLEQDAAQDDAPTAPVVPKENLNLDANDTQETLAEAQPINSGDDMSIPGDMRPADSDALQEVAMLEHEEMPEEPPELSIVDMAGDGNPDMPPITSSTGILGQPAAFAPDTLNDGTEPEPGQENGQVYGENREPKKMVNLDVTGCWEYLHIIAGMYQTSVTQCIRKMIFDHMERNMDVYKQFKELKKKWDM